MNVYLGLVINAAISIALGYFAKKRGWSPWRWATIGFVLPILGALIFWMYSQWSDGVAEMKRKQAPPNSSTIDT